jgi:hypothetical protein
MKKRVFLVGMALLLCVGLQACASLNDKALRLFSARAKAIAIVNGQVLHGTLDLLPDRTGIASLATGAEPAVRCAGTMRYTASALGSLLLRCSDGSGADMQFTALTETTGYAFGQTSTDNSSLTYGLSAMDALAILTPPVGKKLVARIDGEGLELQ